jgi:NADH-quinone oxidoreductase subunit H
MFIEILAVIIKSLFILTGGLILATLLTWAERKESALMQDRIGANRAAILGIRAIGLIHIIADAVKMIMKEDFIPPAGNKFIHSLAPVITFFSALAIMAVIPFGNVLRIGQYQFPLTVADIDVGILFVFAFGSLAVYGTILGGWASNNKLSLLGGMRGAAQMISYEIALGISIIGVAMVYGTLSLTGIVEGQGALLWGFLPKWGIVTQPLGFLLFFTAAYAESKREPFNLPEGESEIVGFWTEYSSMKFGLFFFAEFVEVVIVAMVTTTLFFGGWQLWWLYDAGFVFPWGWVWNLPHLVVVILQVGAFFAKVAFFCWLQLLIRWTFPRFRYDQLMKLGWKILLPLGLINIAITAFLILR